MDIFSLGANLGDNWVSLGAVLRLATKVNDVVHVSTQYKTKKGKVLDIQHRIDEILPLIDGPKDKLKFHNVIPNKRAPKKWAGKSTITKTVWDQSKVEKIITYQLDGKWRADKKNPPNGDVEKLISFLDDYKFVKLGADVSINESVDLLSRSKCFIGICSGFSHIAHSVKTPLFLIKYSMDTLGKYHNNKPYILCKDTEETIDKVTKYVRENAIEEVSDRSRCLQDWLNIAIQSS
jgi:hypothetical protein